MPELRVLLAGCGYIAQAEHIGNWALSRKGKLVGVVDTREELARQTGETLGLPWFTDLERALGLCDCEAVHVCTPANSHPALIRLAAKAGRHVLVEKPLAMDSKGAAEAVQAAQNARVVMMVGYPRIFDSDLIEMGRRIARSDLGNIIGVASVWKLCLPPVYEAIGHWPRTYLPPQEMRGAPLLRHRLLDESVHHLNLFRKWLGDAIRVDAVHTAGPLWHITLTFGRGVPAWHTNASQVAHGEEFWVYGEEGCYYATPWSPHFPWSFGHSRISRRGHQDVVFPTLARQNPYRAQLDEFVASITEQRKPVTDGADAVEDIRLVERIVAFFEAPQSA